MPTFVLSELPQQVSQSITQAATLQNIGPSTIYLGNDSGVSSNNPSLVLTSGASAQWPASSELWACTDLGGAGTLAALYGAEGAMVGTITVPDNLNVNARTQAVFLGEFQTPGTPYQSPFIDVSGFSTLIIAPLEFLSPGGTVNPLFQVSVMFFPTAAAARLVSQTDAVFDSYQVPAYGANLTVPVTAQYARISANTIVLGDVMSFTVHATTAVLPASYSSGFTTGYEQLLVTPGPNATDRIVQPIRTKAGMAYISCDSRDLASGLSVAISPRTISGISSTQGFITLSPTSPSNAGTRTTIYQFVMPKLPVAIVMYSSTNQATTPLYGFTLTQP